MEFWVAVIDNKVAILDFGIDSFDSELDLEYHCGTYWEPLITMKLLCLFLCVYLSILTTLQWLIKDEDFDGFSQFDGFTHTDTDEFTQSETYIPVHLRDITDITNQLNLSATQGNV